MKFSYLLLGALFIGGCGDSGGERSTALDQQVTELQAELRQVRSDLEAAEADLQEAQSDLARAESEWEARNGDAAQALLKAETEVAKLEQLLQAAEAALAEAKKELDGQDYEEVVEGLESVRTTLDALKSAIARAPGTMKLDVAFRYGSEPLQLGTPYDSAGGALTVKHLRYWLTNVSLIDESGDEVVVPNSYYAMELRGELSYSFTAKPDGSDADSRPDAITSPPLRRETASITNVPAGKYTGIAFYVGVDSARNDDLSQPAGELNFNNNLANDTGWMWFTSYIFTTLSATWTSATAAGEPATNVLWENGTNDDYRRIELALDEPVTVDMFMRPRLAVALDAKQVLGALDPSTVNVTLKGEPEAPWSEIGAGTPAERGALADNWANAFELLSVSYPE